MISSGPYPRSEKGSPALFVLWYLGPKVHAANTRAPGDQWKCDLTFPVGLSLASPEWRLEPHVYGTLLPVPSRRQQKADVLKLLSSNLFFSTDYEVAAFRTCVMDGGSKDRSDL